MNSGCAQDSRGLPVMAASTGGQGHALIFTVFFCISLHTRPLCADGIPSVIVSLSLSRRSRIAVGGAAWATRYVPQGHPKQHCQFESVAAQPHRCRGRRVGDPLCAAGAPEAALSV